MRHAHAGRGVFGVNLAGLMWRTDVTGRGLSFFAPPRGGRSGYLLGSPVDS